MSLPTPTSAFYGKPYNSPYPFNQNPNTERFYPQQRGGQRGFQVGDVAESTYKFAYPGNDFVFEVEVSWPLASSCLELPLRPRQLREPERRTPPRSSRCQLQHDRYAIIRRRALRSSQLLSKLAEQLACKRSSLKELSALEPRQKNYEAPYQGGRNRLSGPAMIRRAAEKNSRRSYHTTPRLFTRGEALQDRRGRPTRSLTIPAQNGGKAR